MELESHFERLAPELLLSILTSLPDLESLDSLLNASPAAFRLFDIHGAEIFEAILSSGVTHKYTCALIRVVALVRSSSLPPQVYDLDSFRNLVRHESTPHRYRKPRWTLASSKLSSDILATILRGLLATHRKIVCLTISCLKFYLNRFKPLRPSHLVDKHFSFVSDNNGSNYYVPAWQLKPAEKPFPVQDIGNPTWVEEQRILRAFWRVQLFHDLKTTVDASLVNWPENDIKKLDGMAEVGLYDVPIVNLLDQDDETGERPFVYEQDELLEHELIWSVMYYTKEDRQTVISPKFLQTRRDWPTPTTRGQQDLETINDYSSWTYRFFYELSGSRYEHVASGICSPIQHVSFKTFRCLGFAIWDIERMVGYGFLDPKRRFNNHSYLQAWRSILGRDEIAEVERNDLKRYEESIKSESDETDSDDESEESEAAK